MTHVDTVIRPVMDLVTTATGRSPADIVGSETTPAAPRVENMTTQALDRIAWTLVDGTRLSVVAKTLRPASASPEWGFIPESQHSEVLAALNWLDEPRVYASDLGTDLPPGLRLPVVWQIDESEDRIVIWMEDVADVTPWDADRYHRTAEALGRLGARWPERRAVGGLGVGRRSLDTLFHGKIRHFDLPILAGDEFWAQPAVAAVGSGLRGELGWLTTVVPELIRRSEGLTHGLAHGDAAPDNFREPGDGATVAIDWSYASVAPLGADLGQLLAGRFESGEVDVDDLEPIAAAIFDGYCEGTAAEGVVPDAQHIEEAWCTHLGVRSVFSALIVDHRPDLAPDEVEQLLARRAALCRYGVDLARRVVSRM